MSLLHGQRYITSGKNYIIHTFGTNNRKHFEIMFCGCKYVNYVILMNFCVTHTVT